MSAKYLFDNTTIYFKEKYFYEVMTRNINFSITFSKTFTCARFRCDVRKMFLGCYIIKVLYNLHFGHIWFFATCR